MNLIHSAKRAIQRTGIKTARRLIELRRKSFLKKGTTAGMRFKTALEKNYSNYSKNFVEKFGTREIITKKGKRFLIGKPTRSIYESGFGLSIECELEKEKQVTDIKNATFSLKDKRPRLATIGLGFEKEVLIIEAIQENQEQKKMRNEFWRHTKTRPLELLLLETEELAKKLGFKQIQIRRPETLHYYQYPINTTEKDYEQRRREVQAGMRVTYNRIAKKYGYKKGEFFYTKTL